MDVKTSRCKHKFVYVNLRNLHETLVKSRETRDNRQQMQCMTTTTPNQQSPRRVAKGGDTGGPRKMKKKKKEQKKKGANGGVQAASMRNADSAACSTQHDTEMMQ